MTIFIGGYNRTGTTLMQGIICSDQQTFPATNECTYLNNLIYAYFRGVDLWDLQTKDYFDS